MNCRLAVLGFGADVVDHHGLVGSGFCDLTRGAILVVCSHRLTAQCGSQVGGHTGASGIPVSATTGRRRPRRGMSLPGRHCTERGDHDL